MIRHVDKVVEAKAKKRIRNLTEVSVLYKLFAHVSAEEMELYGSLLEPNDILNFL